MSEPEYVKLVFSRSFLKVYHGETIILLEYGGNMGARVNKEVRDCFEYIYGFGSWDKVYPSLVIREHGSPDYWWDCTFPKETFAKVLSEDENE